MNSIRIDHATKRIIMGSQFFKSSLDPRNEEYTILQDVRRDYPNYAPIQRNILQHTSTPNPLLTSSQLMGASFSFSNAIHSAR